MRKKANRLQPGKAVDAFPGMVVFLALPAIVEILELLVAVVEHRFDLLEQKHGRGVIGVHIKSVWKKQSMAG